MKNGLAAKWTHQAGLPSAPSPSPATSLALALTSPSSRAWASQAEVDTWGQGRVPPQISVSWLWNRQKGVTQGPWNQEENLAREASLLGLGENHGGTAFGTGSFTE